MSVSLGHSAGVSSAITTKLVGQSEPMMRLRAMIGVVAGRDSSVLIHGESGTGKELVARAVHHQSSRAAKPFVAVDCTTLRDTLFESQLFGHSKGAFTGAHRDTLGFARAAEGGTLLLDEVGELDPANQAKLLRFLQDRMVIPLGSVRPIHVDLRVLAATHRDLPAMVQAGTFRMDLYYRLNVVCLTPPPLRDRRDDIPMLIHHMLERLAKLYDEPIKPIAKDAVDQLCRADWPGNVRELLNVIESAFVLSAEQSIGVEHLPARFHDYLPPTDPPPGSGDASPTPTPPSLDQLQRDAVAQALVQTQGHQGQAAQMLQVERRRFYRLVSRFDLKHLTRPS